MDNEKKKIPIKIPNETHYIIARFDDKWNYAFAIILYNCSKVFIVTTTDILYYSVFLVNEMVKNSTRYLDNTL